MKTTIREEFKKWQRLPVATPEPSEPPQGLGVRWVRGEGTHRFGLDVQPTSESGVSPVPPPAAALQDADARTNGARTVRVSILQQP